MANEFGLSYNSGLEGVNPGMTGDAQIAAMYSDIVGDLAVYFNNMVLLPNANLIALNYPISGAVGNTVKIPVQASYEPADSGVAEGRDIIPDYARNFSTTEAMLPVVKRAAGTFITAEAVEDGGASVVTSQVVNQLASSLAQATDKAGFEALLTGVEGAVTKAAITAKGVSIVGEAASGTADYCLVMSPQAGAYASKRAPSVNMDADINADGWITTGTARNGFALVRPEFVVAMESDNGTGLGVTVDDVANAVAQLRAANAPTGADGNYVGVLSPWQEYNLAKELATTGTGGFIQNPSVIGNQTLATGAIGTLLGVTFYRSNNLPQNIAI